MRYANIKTELALCVIYAYHWRLITELVPLYSGAYSQSTGVEVVREDIAAYIEQRDGISASPENIFLATGASEAVKVLPLLRLISWYTASVLNGG